MTNQEILEKAIQKAIDGGWKGGKHLNWSGDWMGAVPKLEVVAPFVNHPSLVYTTGGVDVQERWYPPEVMLFDHEFAEALWGSTPIYDTIYDGDDRVSVADEGLPLYKFLLSRMVIASDPIEYLGENI